MGSSALTSPFLLEALRDTAHNYTEWMLAVCSGLQLKAPSALWAWHPQHPNQLGKSKCKLLPETPRTRLVGCPSSPSRSCADWGSFCLRFDMDESDSWRKACLLTR